MCVYINGDIYKCTDKEGSTRTHTHFSPCALRTYNVRRERDDEDECGQGRGG